MRIISLILLSISAALIGCTPELLPVDCTSNDECPSLHYCCGATGRGAFCYTAETLPRACGGPMVTVPADAGDTVVMDIPDIGERPTATDVVDIADVVADADLDYSDTDDPDGDTPDADGNDIDDITEVSPDAGDTDSDVDDGTGDDTATDDVEDTTVPDDGDVWDTTPDDGDIFDDAEDSTTDVPPTDVGDADDATDSDDTDLPDADDGDATPDIDDGDTQPDTDDTGDDTGPVLTIVTVIVHAEDLDHALWLGSWPLRVFVDGTLRGNIPAMGILELSVDSDATVEIRGTSDITFGCGHTGGGTYHAPRMQLNPTGSWRWNSAEGIPQSGTITAYCIEDSRVPDAVRFDMPNCVAERRAVFRVPRLEKWVCIRPYHTLTAGGAYVGGLFADRCSPAEDCTDYAECRVPRESFEYFDVSSATDSFRVSR